jgi:hypothetical protein
MTFLRCHDQRYFDARPARFAREVNVGEVRAASAEKDSCAAVAVEVDLARLGRDAGMHVVADLVDVDEVGGGGFGVAQEALHRVVVADDDGVSRER